MTVSRQVITKTDNFDRAQAYTTTPAGEFGWTIADTSSSGTPTYLNVTDDGGAAKLTLESTSEAQNVSLYQNDVLPYDWAKIQYVSFIVKFPVTPTSGDTIFFGLANARNDAIASITEKIAFKLVAATSTSAIVIDTKDGTTAVSNVAAGSLTTTYKKFLLDFTNGLADVRAYIDGSRVASGTTFNLSAITSGNNCQIIAQIQKTATTAVSALQLSQVQIQYVTADGA